MQYVLRFALTSFRNEKYIYSMCVQIIMKKSKIVVFKSVYGLYP